LSIDTIQTVEIIALFGHGRVPSMTDFKLIKEGFHVVETSVPQLIFVNNPHKIFHEGSDFNAALEQHKVYQQGAHDVLDNCIKEAENYLERRHYHRMKTRLSTFLFISETHRHLITGNSRVSEVDLSLPLKVSVNGLIRQRLKPASDFIVAALCELKRVLVRSRIANSSSLTIPHSLLEPTEIELVVNHMDEDALRHYVEKLFQKRNSDNTREVLVDFLTKQFANVAVIEMLLKHVAEYHLTEVAFRLFLLCHVSLFSTGNITLSPDVVAQYKETLWDDFTGTLEIVDLISQPAFEDDPQIQKEIIKRGKKRQEVENSEKVGFRDQNFAARYIQLVSFICLFIYHQRIVDEGS
jgi:hypothetical protein